MADVYQKEAEIVELLKRKIDRIQETYENGDKQCFNLFDEIEKTINEFCI